MNTNGTLFPQLKRCALSRSAGYTLAEVLIAVGVGGIIFVTLYTGLAQSFRLLKSAQHRLRATQILTEKMEVIRLYNWSQVTTNGFIPATFTEAFYPTGTNHASSGITYSGKLTVTNAPVHSAYTNTMRRTIAEVTWISSGVTNRLSMETLISQYGIQNYIY